MEHQKPQSNREKYARLAFLGFSIAMALAYDIFFWKKTELGVNLLLFVLIYIVGFILLTKNAKKLKQKYALLFLIPIIIFCANVLFLNNHFVQQYIPIIVLVFGVIFSSILTLENPEKHKFAFLGIPILRDIDLPIQKWGQVIKDLSFWKSGKHKDSASKVLLGIVISIPLLIIFAVLFSNADAIFAQKINSIFDIEINGELLWRIFRTFLITIFLAGFFYAVVAKEYVLKQTKKACKKFDTVVLSTVLILINALFLIFVFIQIKYLFGSANFVLKNNLNFAEYARSGFFELAWVIALASLILFIIYRSFYNRKIPKIITVLQIIFIIQVGVIAVSALRRMNIYQAEFGYTVLRLYVEWFIYFVMLLLAFTVASLSINLQFRKFFYINCVFGVAALCIVSSLNVDKIIAKENVDRYIHQQKELDMKYLLDLSVDAAPEIRRAFENGFVYNKNGQDYSGVVGFSQLYLEHKMKARFMVDEKGQTRMPVFSDLRKSGLEYNFNYENIVNQIRRDAKK